MTVTEQIEEKLSQLYHALRAVRRRRVISYLDQSDNKTLSTRNLAKELASTELGVATQQASGEPYRNAYNALSQTHLPTLSDAGIIIYEPKRQTVCRGPDFELAALLLDTNTPTVVTISSLIRREDGTDQF
jgi:hypothetical protein